MTDDVRKLLGGYATGTLSEDERNQLYSAALQDEELFEALADEQVLKDLLDNSAARAELLRATEARPKRAIWKWLAPVGALSVAAVLAVVGYSLLSNKPQDKFAATRMSIPAM